MKTWRIMAAAAASFVLAAIIGCNADTAKDDNNSMPEPAVQDGGQPGIGGSNAPADEAGAGGGQGAEPSTDGNSGPGDHQIDLPMPVDRADPQTDASAPGESGIDGDGSMSIMPITEPAPTTETLSTGAEPAGSGLIPPGGNASSQGAGVDPDTPVEHRASIGGSDSATSSGPGVPPDYSDGREPASVVQAMPAPRPGR